MLSVCDLISWECVGAPVTHEDAGSCVEGGCPPFVLLLPLLACIRGLVEGGCGIREAVFMQVRVYGTLTLKAR